MSDGFTVEMSSLINRFTRLRQAGDIAERSGSMDKEIKMQSENETRDWRSAEKRCPQIYALIKKKASRVYAHRCTYASREIFFSDKAVRRLYITTLRSYFYRFFLRICALAPILDHLNSLAWSAETKTMREICAEIFVHSAI